MVDDACKSAFNERYDAIKEELICSQRDEVLIETFCLEKEFLRGKMVKRKNVDMHGWSTAVVYFKGTTRHT